MSDSNRTVLAYIEETTWGTTPSSALTVLRHTGESLQDQEEVTESAEILEDRQLRDVIRGGRFAAGDIQFELSYGGLDELLAGVMADDWTTNVLENGNTKKSFTFEKKFNVDGSPAAHYLAFKGCRIDTLSLDISPGQIITGSLGVIGKGGVDGTATAGSGAHTAAGTTEVLSAADISALTEASADPGDPVRIQLEITNNLRRQHALGDTDPIGVGYGGFRVTGRLELYFANMDLYAKYEAETKTELEFTVTDSAGNDYTFTVPKARWGTPEIVIPAVNDDIVAAFPFTAVKDAGTTEDTLNITRAPA